VHTISNDWWLDSLGGGFGGCDGSVFAYKVKVAVIYSSAIFLQGDRNDPPYPSNPPELACSYPLSINDPPPSSV
jgi:hypothetical protein